MVTAGGSLGLVLGGLITQWASWRWVLFVNVPIGIAVTVLTPLFVTETPRQPGRFDLPGAVTSTAGVAALVYAFIRAASDGWGDQLAASPRSPSPPCCSPRSCSTRPGRRSRSRRCGCSRARAAPARSLARLLLVGGMFGMFFFLTQFLQDVLGFGALRAGVAFLPMTLLLFAVSRLAPRLIPRVGGQRLMLAGMLPVIAGMAWLSRVSPGTDYWSGVFGPMVLLGVGMGVVFVPLTTASLAGVRPQESGAASSMVNVMQQLGGSVGLAVLVAVFGTATRASLAHPVAGLTAAALHRQVLAHGMSTAFTLAAVFDVAAFVVIAALLRDRRPRVPDTPAGLAEAETTISAVRMRAVSKQGGRAGRAAVRLSRSRVWRRALAIVPFSDFGDGRGGGVSWSLCLSSRGAGPGTVFPFPGPLGFRALGPLLGELLGEAAFVFSAGPRRGFAVSAHWQGQRFAGFSFSRALWTLSGGGGGG